MFGPAGFRIWVPRVSRSRAATTVSARVRS